MFRSSEKPNPLDSLIIKATDENLTSENWELILNVCDAVNEDPEDGAKNAVNSVSKRLNIPNANVQMYSLTLISSMAQNCGSKMQRELASKSFTKLLLKMTEDKTVHSTVKSRIAELMESLTEEFKSDPSLRLMNDAYVKLMKLHPSINPPAKPDKNAISETDKKREQDELQLALALSLSESQQPKFLAVSGNEAHSLESVSGNVQAEAPAEKSAVTVRRVRALYDLTASESGELSFRKGDIIQVIESVYRDWWRGSLRGQRGIFPLNYVEPLSEPTKEELFKEAQDELRVFEQSRNIEKLLVLLNSADANSQILADNEDVQNLYHSTLSVRPKLVKLIDKYAQKKDELIELNEKFLRARKKYDHLMEDSMTQYTRRHSAGSRPPYPIQPVQQAPYPSSPTGEYQGSDGITGNGYRRSSGAGDAAHYSKSSAGSNAGYASGYQQPAQPGERRGRYQQGEYTAQAPYQMPQYSGEIAQQPASHSGQPGYAPYQTQHYTGGSQPLNSQYSGGRQPLANEYSGDRQLLAIPYTGGSQPAGTGESHQDTQYSTGAPPVPALSSQQSAPSYPITNSPYYNGRVTSSPAYGQSAPTLPADNSQTSYRQSVPSAPPSTSINYYASSPVKSP